MPEEHTSLVVGVDGTEESDSALAFALDEAARTGDTVEVVTVWHPLAPPLSYPVLPVGGTSEGRDALRRCAESLQREALERVAARSGVAVSTQVVEGSPGPALVEAARAARLLVVGSRALGPVRAALLGSVSRYCAHHATAPVVVVPSQGQPRASGGQSLVGTGAETTP